MHIKISFKLQGQLFVNNVFLLIFLHQVVNKNIFFTFLTNFEKLVHFSDINTYFSDNTSC